MGQRAGSLLLFVSVAVVAAACSQGGGSETTTEPPATTIAVLTTTTPQVTATPPTTSSTPTGVSCETPITVGVITDLTGALAIYGAHMSRGVPIGFAYATGGTVQTGPEQTYTLDGCEIRVLFRDDQTNPETGLAAARELIDVEGADIIIGSVGQNVTTELQGIAADRDVILIVAPATSTELTGADFDPNTFRVSRSSYQDSMAICDHAVNGDGQASFVQIAPDTAVGRSDAQAYRDSCTFYGGDFVADDVLAPASTIEFEPYLTPLAEADADGFLISWVGGGLKALLESSVEVGVVDDETALGVPFVDNLVTRAFFANVLGTTSVISYHYTAPSNPANDYLIDQAASTFQTIPDLYDADGMNAAILVIEALRLTDGAADADSLKAVLEGLSFEGPKDVIEIRAEDHVALQDIYVVTLHNVDNAESKYYENVATSRPEPPCLLEGNYLTRCGDLPTGSLVGS